MKIRKNHVKKRYRYSINRKNLKKKHQSTGKIKDLYLKKVYEDSKKPSTNFKQMGLSADPNKAVAIPSYRQQRLCTIKLVNGFVEEEIDEAELKQKSTQNKTKGFVVEELEKQSKLRAEPQLRLPKGVVKHLTYFLDKYKFDYKAMVNDKRNFDQWTWKQFRMKIRKFVSIPEQFNEYLEKHHLPLGKKLPWPEYDSDGEWR